MEQKSLKFMRNAAHVRWGTRMFHRWTTIGSFANNNAKKTLRRYEIQWKNGFP